jgi:ABC-2 type transport system permease protein
MTMLSTVARQELLASRRNRAPQFLIVMFIAMVAVSAMIGWLTNTTVSDVYRQVLAEGYTDQPNPFDSIAQLYYAHNTVIYVVLIGSLMAIALGVQSALRDRKASTADLVLTRPIRVKTLLAGRLLGIAVLLAAVVALGMVITWATISVINGGPLGVSPTVRLVAFGGLTWVFLCGFAVSGVLAGVYIKRETTALLVPFVAWAVVVFVLPQLGTAARPVSLLNPVALPPQTTGIFHWLSYVTSPLSIGENFKTASSGVLDAPLSAFPWASAAVVSVFMIIAVVVVLFTPAAKLRGGAYE